MAIGLIGWGRFLDHSGNKITVIAPSTEADAPWLWDMLGDKAASLANSFDFIQLPPISMTQSGSAPTGDGYGISWRRNLGWTGPTRYGHLESLLRMVARFNAAGLETFGDLVLHQLIPPENGGPGVASYPGADGKTMNGRGATTAGWFRGNLSWDATEKRFNDPVPPFCKEDDVPDIGSDAAFGREISYQHCNPSRVTTEDAVDYLGWMAKRTGIRNYRLDDVKGMYAPTVSEIVSSLPGGQFYGEYFDGNPFNLNGWAAGSTMRGRAAVEDFTLHFRIQAACNGYDATQFLQGGPGYWLMNSGLAAGFTDNPDTDLSGSNNGGISMQVAFNKGIAYAVMLMLPMRYALVYGKDYFPSSVWPGSYGLKPLIDNLCWISRTFAFGAYQQRWVDKDVYAFTRDGNGGAVGFSGGLLTAVNFNTLSSRTITVGTTFGPHRWLHDYTGHSGDISTDASGNATITIPSNAFSSGASYVQYAPGGVNQPFPMHPRQTTQIFIGDRTIDIMPAENGILTLRERIRCKKGSALSLKVTSGKEAWTVQSQILTTISGPKGEIIAQHKLTQKDGPAVQGGVQEDGWQTIRLTGQNLPTSGSNFQASITYTGA